MRGEAPKNENEYFTNYAIINLKFINFIRCRKTHSQIDISRSVQITKRGFQAPPYLFDGADDDDYNNVNPTSG